MTVHALHIFDRRGKTLFTKRYSNAAMQQLPQPQQTPAGLIDVDEQLAEQRKLVFGLLFSLRELAGSVSPEQSNNEVPALHSVRTGATTLHNYETISGLRFAIYTDNDCVGGYGGGSSSSNSNSSRHYQYNDGSAGNASIREALRYIYTDIWVDCVIRSPLYRHGQIRAAGENPAEDKEIAAGNTSALTGRVDIKSTLFEKKLDEYLMSMPWFK